VNLPVAELQDSRQPKKQIVFIVPKIVELASTGPLFRGNGPDAVAYYAPRASQVKRQLRSLPPRTDADAGILTGDQAPRPRRRNLTLQQFGAAPSRLRLHLPLRFAVQVFRKDMSVAGRDALNIFRK
jgi:hypothetical protein